MLPPSVADRIQPGTSSMSLLLEAAAERTTKVKNESPSQGSTLDDIRRQRKVEDSGSQGSTPVDANASGVPPSVYIRASKAPQEAASASPLTNSGANDAEPSYAALLHQLLQPPVQQAPFLQPPVADSTTFMHAISSLLNTKQTPSQPPQPNPAQMTFDLLQLLGKSEPRAPINQVSGSAPSIFETPRTSSEPTNVYPGHGSDVPGSKRVSCRARGMPPDHCSESAYFWIHPDMAHGGDLLCSYPGCRASGVKFRYCKVCRVPAAKRSFLFRHGHSLRNQRESPPVTSEAEVSCSGSVGSETPANVRTTSSSDSSTLTENQGSLKSTSPSVVSHESAKTKKRRRDATDVESTESSMTTSSEDSRTSRWRALLNERPEDNDEDKMSVWLMRVMQVSDMRDTSTQKMEAPTLPTCHPCMTTKS
eukprot:Nitzschia sp. Nitz4//scaffold175_size95217//83634//84979//NITZ4_004737-RA/size95217-processed-gene-0.36-mRNA-1//1//CDS//3329538981//4618//frame0